MLDRETIARTLYEADHKGLKNCWEWADPGLDDEHPGRRLRYYNQGDAILAAIIAALAGRVVVQGWQPIDSAPRDGTEILGVFHSIYEGFAPTLYGPWTVAWDRKKWRSSWDGSEVIEYQSDFGTEYKEPDIQPTHWMPMPATADLTPAHSPGELP